MKRAEAIKRAKEFLLNLKHISIEDLDFPSYDFSNPQKSYYVYMDVEIKGCFENTSKFMNKKEVNDFVSLQFQKGNHWNNIVILDVRKNRIIKPHI